jgi:ABC-type lipoprotein export system ATPase subunit
MRKIVKKFKTAAGEVTVLKGVDASFYPGEFVGVVGKSGSGKSTLVNMLTGIDKPTSGEIQVGETLVHHLNESDRSKWRGINLGIVFQFYQLMPVLSLLENTMLPMDIAGKIPPADRESRAMDLLKMVGLEDVAHKMPAGVSGGQQQAAAIARAMANDPPLIVADEPTGNLDSRTAEKIFDIFENLAGQGKTILVVTHDPQLARRTTRTVLLCDGEIIHPAVDAGLHWLNHNQMLRVTHHSQAKRFGPGETILALGQTVENLYLVSSGLVDIQPSGSGRSSQIGSGKLFGQLALLSGCPAGAAVTAKEETEVLVVEAGIVTELISTVAAMRSGLLKPEEALV